MDSSFGSDYYFSSSTVKGWRFFKLVLDLTFGAAFNFWGEVDLLESDAHEEAPDKVVFETEENEGLSTNYSNDGFC